MLPSQKSNLVYLIRMAEDLNANIEKIVKYGLNTIDGLAEKYSNKTSEYLAGVAGGLLGLIGGLIFNHYYDNELLYSCGIGMPFGVILSILIWRGVKQYKIERINKRHDLIKTKVLADIISLSEDAPEDIKSQYWEIYRLANTYYQVTVTKKI